MDSLNDLLYNVSQSLLSLLPLSPFSDFLDSFADLPFLGYINYFIPVHDLLVVTGAWLAGVALYYLYLIAMRWFKVIS